MNTTTPTITDGFRAMLLREFYTEPRLPEEFKAASFANWVGNAVSKPASYVVAAKYGIPSEFVEGPVRFICGIQNTTLIVRSFSDWLASWKSSRNTYESSCRSALCYAITNSQDWAFGALRVAASKNDNWARHHHIYGLIHGERGNFKEATFELGKARFAEPHDDVKSRIDDAIHLANGGEFAGSDDVWRSTLQWSDWESASDAILVIMELMDAVRPSRL